MIHCLFQSHKNVCTRKHRDLSSWHAKWAEENVSEEQSSKTADWFMGRCEGLVRNQTTKVVKNWAEKAPYRTFHKYRAELIGSPASAAAGSASPSVNAASEAGKSATASTT